MLESFDSRVIKWYVIEESKSLRKRGVTSIMKLYERIKNIDYSFKSVILLFHKGYSLYNQRKANRDFIRWNNTAENYLFKEEVARLRKKISAKPTVILNPNSIDFYKEIEQLRPYFFISLGGPLFSREILKHVRGCSINQHAGHSPDFKGDSTILWALYHRESDKISSTVHITAEGADTGGILRRVGVCSLEGENPAIYFNRVVALGTELIIEVVEDVFQNKPIYYHPQPKFTGKTKLSFHMERKVRYHLWLDYKERVIDYLLAKQREF